MGVERVGLLGFSWLTSSLTLCVASVFAPGSLFYLVNGGLEPTSHPSPPPLANATEDLWNVTATEDLWNVTATEDLWNVTATEAPRRQITNYTSVVMLLSGIIISRFGKLTIYNWVTKSFLFQLLFKKNAMHLINMF